MRALLCLALVPNLASAEPDPVATKQRDELITAINKRDIATVTSHVTLPLHVSNVAFTAPACTKFAGKIEVEEADLTAFVGCLADLGVKNLTGPDDVFVNAVYGPGFPLILPNDHGRLVFGWAKPGSDMFTIEPLVFTSHIKKFNREIAPDADVKKTIDASTTDHREAMLTVCVDGKGVVKAMALPDDPDPAYAARVEKVAAAWSIKPFAFAGKPIEACARFTVGYPAGRITPLQMKLPPPPPPPSPSSPPPPSAGFPSTPTVPPNLLEGSRISGEKVIVPDDATKSAITASKKDKIIASFKLCVDDSGAVTNVVGLKSSGFPAYDAKIIREMNKWKYRPYLVNGKAAAVCTAVTFVYSQH